MGTVASKCVTCKNDCLSYCCCDDVIEYERHDKNVECDNSRYWNLSTPDSPFAATTDAAKPNFHCYNHLNDCSTLQNNDKADCGRCYKCDLSRTSCRNAVKPPCVSSRCHRGSHKFFGDRQTSIDFCRNASPPFPSVEALMLGLKGASNAPSSTVRHSNDNNNALPKAKLPHYEKPKVLNNLQKDLSRGCSMPFRDIDTNSSCSGKWNVS